MAEGWEWDTPVGRIPAGLFRPNVPPFRFHSMPRRRPIPHPNPNPALALVTNPQPEHDPSDRFERMLEFAGTARTFSGILISLVQCRDCPPPHLNYCPPPLPGRCHTLNSAGLTACQRPCMTPLAPAAAFALAIVVLRRDCPPTRPCKSLPAPLCPAPPSPLSLMNDGGRYDSPVAGMLSRRVEVQFGDPSASENSTPSGGSATQQPSSSLTLH